LRGRLKSSLSKSRKGKIAKQQLNRAKKKKNCGVFARAPGARSLPVALGPSHPMILAQAGAVIHRDGALSELPWRGAARRWSSPRKAGLGDLKRGRPPLSASNRRWSDYHFNLLRGGPSGSGVVPREGEQPRKRNDLGALNCGYNPSMTNPKFVVGSGFARMVARKGFLFLCRLIDQPPA